MRFITLALADHYQLGKLLLLLKVTRKKSKSKFNIYFKKYRENEKIYDYTINNNKLLKSGYKLKYTLTQELEKLYFFCKKIINNYASLSFDYCDCKLLQW